MKRQYYLILGGLVCLTAIFGFIGINTNTVPKTEEPTITLGKELAYATTGFTKDSSKLNEIQAEIDSELIKINEELNALEEEIEVVHDKTIARSEEHTSELQSRPHLVCRLLLEK